MSPIMTQNPTVRAQARKNEQTVSSVTDANSPTHQAEKAYLKGDLKGVGPNRAAAALGSGDQLTKLFAKATATAVSREDRNVVAGQLKATKADLSLAQKQIEQKDAALAAAVQELNAIKAKLHEANSTDTVQLKLNATIQQRDAITVERDAVTQKLNATIQQHDIAVLERDCALHTYEAVVAERDCAVQQHEAMAIQRDNAIQGQANSDWELLNIDRFVHEKEVEAADALKQRDTAIRQRDAFKTWAKTAIHRRNVFRDQRNTHFMARYDTWLELETTNKARNAIILERDAAVQERTKAETELRAAINARDAISAVLDAISVERNDALRACNDAETELRVTIHAHDTTTRDITLERDVAVQGRVDTETELRAAIQARDIIAIERDAAVQGHINTEKELRTAIQARDAITVERDIALQERIDTETELRTVVQARDSTTVERDAAIQENISNKTALNAAVEAFDAMQKNCNGLAQEHDLQDVKNRLKKSEDIIFWQAAHIASLEAEEHKISSLEMKLHQSEAIQIDNFVEIIHLQLEISDLRRQLAKNNSNAANAEHIEHLKQVARDATDEAAFAQQQRDNAYIVCHGAQLMNANSAAKIAHYEQLLKNQKLTYEATAKTLIDTQQEVIKFRAINEILRDDLEAEKKKAAEHECEVATYFALPKSEQRSRNQPSAEDCPCYFHVSRALKVARTFDASHREELANMNYRQMCLVDELVTLKREVRAGISRLAESPVDEGGNDETSDAGSEDSIEIIISRSASSPPSSK